MKNFITLLTIFSFFFIAKAQDRVTLKTGEEKNVKIVEVGINEVKYKKTIDGPLYVLKKSDIFMITYADSTKDLFGTEKNTPVINTPPSVTHTDYEKGVRDAEIFYSPSGATTGTFLTTIFGTALLGLIPAIACSSTPPKHYNLDIPLDRITLSNEYNLGYIDKASQIKKRKVWKVWGIGLGINVITLIIVSQL